jgi:hypothetical protein
MQKETPITRPTLWQQQQEMLPIRLCNFKIIELVRALKCAELQQKGFTIYPGSRVAHMCQDIVPIQSLLPKKDVSTTKTNRSHWFKK